MRSEQSQKVKGLEDLEIRGQVETIRTITLLRLARILRKVLEAWDLSPPTPMENHQLTQVWKPLEGVIMIIDGWPNPNLVLINKKKKCYITDFAVPTDHWVKTKESEKLDKYLDLARKMTVTTRSWSFLNSPITWNRDNMNKRLEELKTFWP